MSKFIITGTTGFLGSAIACDLINQGHEVIALSRNDKKGDKTLKTIYEACMGYGYSFDASKIKVFDLYSDNLLSELKDHVDSETQFLHSAAHMSYAWKSMGDAAEFNVSFSTKLLLLARDLGLKSFNYISTLFTSNDYQDVPEEIHLFNHPQNTYQTSKWFAENQLSLLANNLDFPIRIFRPGIVIGHSETGWSSCKAFGFFMFLLGFMQVKSMGKKVINIDLDPEVELPLVCIDDISSWIGQFLESDNYGFFNLAYNHTKPAQINNLRKLIQNELRIEINFGGLNTLHDFAFDRKVKLNKDFAQKIWNFHTHKLDSQYGPRSLDNSSMIKSIAYFVKHYEADPKKLDVLRMFRKSKDHVLVVNDFIKNKIKR